MPSIRLLEKIFDPYVFSLIMVAFALFLLSGIFNILYTASHNPEEFMGAMSRIGPVQSGNLQNFTELVMVFVGYMVFVWGLYLLYDSSRRTQSGARYALIFGLVFVVISSILLAVLFYVKRY